MDGSEVVSRYFAAMRRGEQAETEMLALFAPDAVYIEPFTGIDQPAVGREEIRARLRRGWESPLPEMELDILEIEIDGSHARSTWECRSPGLPHPVRGEDRYEIADGCITRLEVRLFPDN